MLANYEELATGFKPVGDEEIFFIIIISFRVRTYLLWRQFTEISGNDDRYFVLVWRTEAVMKLTRNIPLEISVASRALVQF